jgi:hypothetical protein
VKQAKLVLPQCCGSTAAEYGTAAGNTVCRSAAVAVVPIGDAQLLRHVSGLNYGILDCGSQRFSFPMTWQRSFQRTKDLVARPLAQWIDKVKLWDNVSGKYLEARRSQVRVTFWGTYIVLMGAMVVLGLFQS